MLKGALNRSGLVIHWLGFIVLPILSLTILLIACSAQPKTTHFPVSPEKIRLLQQALNQYRAEYHIPGVSVSIMVPDIPNGNEDARSGYS